MINRFIEKLKDPKERKYFAALLGGKFLGVSLCFLLIFGVTSIVNKVHAQSPAPAASVAASPAAIRN